MQRYDSREKTLVVSKDQLSVEFIETVYNLLSEKLTECEKNTDERIDVIINLSADEVRREYVLNPTKAASELVSNFDLFKIKQQQIFLRFAPVTLDLETVSIKTRF